MVIFLDMDINQLRKDIGLRVLALRKLRSLTQKEFSVICDIPRSGLAKIEIGMLLPTIPQCTRMKKKLEISIDWLLTGTIDIPRFKTLQVEIIEMLCTIARDENLSLTLLKEYKKILAKRRKWL